MDGKQGGDPAKLAAALVELAGLEEPPARFAAGADAVQTFEAKAKTLLAQADAHRALSSSLALRRRLSTPHSTSLPIERIAHDTRTTHALPNPRIAATS